MAIRHSMNTYLVFGPCLYAATSRLIDIDISQLLRKSLIKPTLTGWHPVCKPRASMFIEDWASLGRERCLRSSV